MRDAIDRIATGFIGTASPLAAVLSLQNIEANYASYRSSSASRSVSRR